MKKTILPASPVALLAVVGLALSPGHAGATQPTVNATDVLVGFEGLNSGSPTGEELLVDLGPASQFQSGGTFTPVNLSNDLQTAFGTTWYVNSGTPLVSWGLVGIDKFGALPGDVFDTVFLSQDAANSNPVGELNSSAASTTVSAITNTKNQFALQTSGTDNAEAAELADSNTYSFFSQNAFKSQAFKTGLDIEQINGDGPTDSTLDFFQLTPATSGDATELGSFQLSSGGELSFTAGAVPEPSTWATLIAGILLLGFFRRNRRALRAS
jgi:hypothetical protein